MREIDQGTFGRSVHMLEGMDDVNDLDVPIGWVYYDEDGNPIELKEFPENDFRVFFERE